MITIEERRDRGLQARRSTPLSAHASVPYAILDRDPVAVLAEQAKTRIADLVPIRYGRMLASPFAFYRGAAKIMATDLAAGPFSGLEAQLCGDAHLANFGVYYSPERRMVFDLNDFDETLAGPFELDVKRFAASLEVAGRDNHYSRKDRQRLVKGAVRRYRESMHQFASMTNLEVWYARIDLDTVMRSLKGQLGGVDLRRTEAIVAKARTHDNLHAFQRLTETGDNGPRIVNRPPLIVPARALHEVFGDSTADQRFLDSIEALLTDYRGTLSSERQHLFDQYRLVDVARKVVGIGSVGTMAWILLFIGKDDHDPVFLQAKQAEASVLEGPLPASTCPNHGERIVEGQRLMQATSDLLLGWQRVPGPGGLVSDFYLRQLRDGKGSLDVAKAAPDAMSAYAQVCAWTLARAHARSGDRIAIDAYLNDPDDRTVGKEFDAALAEFASSYADRNQADHAALQAAVDSGRVTATFGV